MKVRVIETIEKKYLLDLVAEWHKDIAMKREAIEGLDADLALMREAAADAVEQCADSLEDLIRDGVRDLSLEVEGGDVREIEEA